MLFALPVLLERQAPEDLDHPSAESQVMELLLWLSLGLVMLGIAVVWLVKDLRAKGRRTAGIRRLFSNLVEIFLSGP
jgi:hypothetical protein